jgi:thiamine biosynthesis lipoprotein
MAMLPGLASCARAPEEIVISGPTMGTTYTVKAVVADPAASEALLANAVESVLARIDLEMSTYRPDSALARFNASQSTAWVAVPDDLARVIAAAQTLSELTGGAFDVTVAPLVDLWGFGPRGPDDVVPPAAAVDAARERVDFRALEVRSDPPALRKRRGDLEVDLNAIAPGFAVDLIAHRLDRLGIERYLIDVGGEIRGRGASPQDRPWRVAVERPTADAREPYAIIALENRAVATSGDYRQYFERAGTRYSHALDPRTGRPVAAQLASVAVVSDSALIADGLATALSVLGPEAGYAFVVQHELAALFILRDGDGFAERSTPQFERIRIKGRS